jgi:hypothetical protein
MTTLPDVFESRLKTAQKQLGNESDPSKRANIKWEFYTQVLKLLAGTNGCDAGYLAHCALYLETLDPPKIYDAARARLTRFHFYGVYGYTLRPGDRVWFASEFGYDEPKVVQRVDWTTVYLAGATPAVPLSPISIGCRFLTAPQDYVNKDDPKYQDAYWLALADEHRLFKNE